MADSACRSDCAGSDRFGTAQAVIGRGGAYAASIHMDGNITMAAPQEVQEGTPEEIVRDGHQCAFYARHFATGPKGDLGRSPEVVGHNFGVLFKDPQMSLSLGSFIAFAFVALNDQTVEGCGQTAVLPGAHHHTERYASGSGRPHRACR